MPFVNSSAISRIEYDAASKRMYVTFRGSGTYTFCRVPQSVYQAFLRASSKGSFYHDHIKDKYDC